MTAQAVNTFSCTGELGCDSGYVFLADKCYKFHQVQVPRSQAKANCEAEQAHLASVLNEAEYTAMLGHMNANCELTHQTFLL